MLRHYIIAWFSLIPIAIANGVLRESFFTPALGPLQSHQLSTLTLILAIMLYLWILGTRWRIQSSRAAWLIGAAWLLMTVAFEFGFGHYIMGHPWSHLLADYNLLSGRVWVLVLLAMLLAPVAAFHLFHRRATAY